MVDYIEKASKIKEQTMKLIKKQTWNSLLVGGAIGGVTGIGYSLFKHKNIISGLLIGSLLGMAISFGIEKIKK